MDRGRLVSSCHYVASNCGQSSRSVGQLVSQVAAISIDPLTGITRKDSSMMTNQLDGNGLRWGQRIPVDIPVQVAAHASPAIHGHLKNLSLSGAFMGIDHELRLNAYIEINVQLSKTGRRCLNLMARVTRISKDGVGVGWCEFAPNALKELLPSPSSQLSL